MRNSCQVKNQDLDTIILISQTVSLSFWDDKMCGLIAIFSKKDLKVDQQAVQKMTDSIIHRGPDDEGIYCQDWIGLGFRRLSIIDPSPLGHQPMLDKSGRYVCVFNGEIYNYRELRQTLESQGVTFLSHSDSEVLLNAYIQWGAASLHKFIGMFAFIIVDLEEKSLFIARDFPGIKPLYFTEDKDFYYFSSEIKAFSKIMALSVNVDCYYEQFSFRYLSGDRTHFKNVLKVLPGYYWKITQKKMEKQVYFNVADTFFPKLNNRSFSEVVSSTQEVLQNSFMLHTRSDVGYCVQLSGGVDSSYLASSIVKKTNNTIHTFSVELDHEQLDESIFQQQVAVALEAHHHGVKMLVSDYADSLERATYYMEAPVVHSGCVFLMKLCQHIGRVSKVVLTGEGADEVFGGYWRHKPTSMQHALFYLQKYKIDGKWLPNIAKLITVKHLLNNGVILNSHRYQEVIHFRQFFTCPETVNEDRAAYSTLVSNDYIDAILAYDQLTYITSVLDRQDKLSMSYSVEARVPYCHQHLYGHVNALPSRYKIYKGVRKAILKQCASFYLEKEIVYRRKNGLNLPLADWYRDKNTVGKYLDLLCDTIAEQRGIYNMVFIKKALLDFLSGSNRYAKAIIGLVNLELWHRVFNL